MSRYYFRHRPGNVSLPSALEITRGEEPRARERTLSKNSDPVSVSLRRGKPIPATDRVSSAVHHGNATEMGGLDNTVHRVAARPGHRLRG